MARGMYYGSYKKPRVTLWTIGVIIFLLMIITAFMGKYTKTSPKLINKVPIQLTPFNKINNIRFYSTKKLPTDLTDSNLVINEILGDIKLVKYWENLDLKSVQINLNLEVKNKSGIYIIINKISKNFYIGSAHYNKLYTRMRSHLFNFSGNKMIFKSVKKYGVNNFIYGILEYVDINPIIKNNTKKLYILETSYISLLVPKYNILTEACSALIYKHNEETLYNMKTLFIKERRELLKQLQTNSKNLNIITIVNKTINLYNTENVKICTFNSINKMANFICCNSKIIKRSLNKGYIYIPKPYIQYLTNENILNYNNIREIIGKLELKSSLLLTKNLIKVYISY